LIRFSLRYALRMRPAWSALLILMFSVAILSYEVVTPTADSLERRLEEYTAFSSGYITALEYKQPKGMIITMYSPFDIEGSIRIVAKEHPGWFASNASIERFIQSLKNQVDLNRTYPFSKEGIEDVMKVDHVKTVYPMLIFDSEYITFQNSTSTEVMGFTVLSVDPAAAGTAILPFSNMDSGRFLMPGEDKCVISQTFRSYGFDLGGDMPVTIMSREKRYEIVGVMGYGVSYSLMHGLGVIMNVETVWRELEVSPDKQRYNALLIQVDDPGQGYAVMETIRGMYNSSNVMFLWQAEQAWMYTRLLESTAPLYGSIKVLLIAFAAASIVILRLIEISRNRRDLGLLIALGWKEKDIMKYQLIGSLIIGLLGATIGIAMSYVVGKTIADNLVSESLKIAYSIYPKIPDPAYVMNALLLAIGLSLITFLVTYTYQRRTTPLKLLESY